MSLLSNLIRWARITLAGADDGEYPIQQVEYMDKTGESYMLFPYGMHGNVPPDYLGLMLMVNGRAESRVVIPTSHQKRVKSLPEGELIIFHPPTGSKIHFKANGDIEVTAPDIKLDGNVEITGNLLVLGNTIASAGTTSLGATVTSDGTAIGSTHKHSGVQSGGSNTGNPI